jgi:endo-alpha-1,4-polygalactosaminidase (GH114 family)
VFRNSAICAALLSIGAAACGGSDVLGGPSASSAITAAPHGAGPTDAGSGSAPTPVVEAPSRFRGDGSKMPAWGGWAWGSVPADAVARAGFDWFETGYPGDVETNRILLAAGVRPFAYINLGELHDDLRAAAQYTGPILRTNGDWGTYLVDVTHISWQDWLVRRADEAYRAGSRGIKWDVATPDVPPGKTRADVNDAMASVMKRVLDMHPEMKFVVNQGADFALAYPEFVHAVQTEGLLSASSYPSAYCKPWDDPYYWGGQYKQIKEVQKLGVPIIVAEYADPASPKASELYDAITREGFVPYITNDHWNIRGRGYNVAPGW